MKKISMSAILLSAFLFAGCTTTLNLSLINSRSPSINALGENDTEATTGFEGGGQLDAQIPISP